jgi:hypothetical protein
MAIGKQRIALIDFALFVQIADHLNGDYAFVAGRKLDRNHAGNSPGHFFLADGRHPGTLGQAELARMFIAEVNGKFGAGIDPLRDDEILALADDHPGAPAQRDLLVTRAAYTIDIPQGTAAWMPAEISPMPIPGPQRDDGHRARPKAPARCPRLFRPGLMAVLLHIARR